MRFQAWVLGVTCASLTACGVAQNDPTGASSAALKPCAAASLSVTVVDQSVRAVNTGQDACALSGRDAVAVPWWRIVGGPGVAATGTLPAGGALVQAFKVEGSNGCPWAGDRGGLADLVVTVEGRANLVRLPARVVHEITTCVVVSAPPPRIEPWGTP